MRHWTTLLSTGLVTGTVALAACGDDGGGAVFDARPRPDAQVTFDAMVPDGGAAMIPEDLPSPLPDGTVNIKLANYNTGLFAAVVKGADERMPLQVAALKALDADVICIEELFNPQTSPKQHAALLADTYPHSYWSWTGDTVAGNGLLVVSKHPLYRGREFFYTMGNNASVDRMALGVTVVDTNNQWHANVLCTHLHAGLKTPDLPKRLDEVNELIAFSTAQGYDTGPTFLLGDFNAGPVPASADVCECDDTGDTNAMTCKKCDAADVAAYDQARIVFTDPFAGNDPNTGLPYDFATSGRAQFLALAVVPGLFPDEPSQRIDHCMYKDIGSATFKPASSGLALNETQSIDIGGGEIIEFLSDHFAITCSFGP